MAVLGIFPDSMQALQRYVQLHHKSPERELYVLHADRTQSEFDVRQRLSLHPASCALIPDDQLLITNY